MDDVAFFGGTFDPVHEGHIDAVRQVLAKGFRLVVVCPTSWNPWKEEQPSSMDDRLCWWRKVLEYEGIPIASDFDGEGVYLWNFKYTRTWQVVLAWFGRHECALNFVCGTDTESTVNEWEHWNAIKDKVKLVVVGERTSTHATHVREANVPPHPAIAAALWEKNPWGWRRES